MVVGVMELTLAVPAGSLKEKRSIIRKIMGRTRSKFPISLKWQSRTHLLRWFWALLSFPLKPGWLNRP